MTGGEPQWPEGSVGSVMPLALPRAPAAPGEAVWDAWTGTGRSVAAFRTARSALAALIALRGAKTLWVPAYVCGAVADSARTAGAALRFFAVDERLEPDPAALLDGAAAGDAVLMVDYFGRPPGEAFTALGLARPDLLWIEDRAQALDPAAPAWGAVVLYSPRKLFGVADGGLLVGAGDLPHPGPAEPGAAAALFAPQMARFDDPDGRDPSAWFPAFQALERGLQVDRAPMSRLSRALLAQIPIRPEVEARRRNYQRLHAWLEGWALWPGSDREVFAPLAFPIVVEDAEALGRRLAEDGVFCARHWPDLPSPPEAFPQAHALSRRLLSVPCDPRYDEDRMDRVGRLVARRLGA